MNKRNSILLTTREVLIRAVTFSAVIFPAALLAQPRPVPVHKVQGTSHAFLVLRTESGSVLGYGELLQLIHGDRVSSRLTYHFRDGSIDDDTTVFSQHTAFHLIRDHHTQRGPFFSKASDCLVEENGSITIRTVDQDGKEKIELSHIDLPPDVSNGFAGTMLLNASPSSSPFKLSFVAPMGRGRLIQLSIDVAGEEPFSPVLGVRRKATVFRVHPELGGMAGVVARVIGKQPKDVFIWVLEGEVPGLVREIGPLEQGGQVVSIEPAGASYPPAGETAIPIIEEQLAVGKREVDRGGVRVYSHVVEKPVSADVTLRDEMILVERRPVNRVATAADFNMGQGSVIELNATGEEAVIGKTAHVVEEIVVGKSSTSRTEVIHDSVRKTEVEVEQIPGTATTTKDRY